MIATNVLFKPGKSPEGLFMEAIQTTFGTINISSIVRTTWDKFRERHVYRVALLAPIPAGSLGPEMGIVVAGTNNHDATYTVKDIDFANNIIRLYHQTAMGPDETGIGNVTVGGTIPEGIVIPGTILTNNDGQPIFNTYQSSGSFVFKTRNDSNPVVQVTELGTGGLAIDIKFSLDRVNWLDFPTPISSVAIAASNSGAFILNQSMMTDIYIKVDVTAGANSNYYVLAK